MHRTGSIGHLFMKNHVIIIGGGLAGAEAACYLAQNGIQVTLYEMRPIHTTPVHNTPYFAELVCSNSLGSFSTDNASGLLKEEIKRLGSTLIPAAFANSVPAGGALAVDRDNFARQITDFITHHPMIEVKHEQVHDIHIYVDSCDCILIATGPLTSADFAASLGRLTGQEYLHFYDAVAPIIDAETIDMSIAYKMDRYNKTPESSYINCPMTEEEYNVFYEFLVNAPTIELKEFEKAAGYFEGCMPVEVMAKRGKDTIRYGPMKPVGLPLPQTGKDPYAAVQLRQDNVAASLYNMVGFQTNLKWSAQKDLIKLIPGLQNATIVRYGVMHRNTYINSPVLLNPTLESKFKPALFFAGQLTGVEGYTESIATGLLAAINIKRKIDSKKLLEPGEEIMLGSLCRYISTADPENFQPMNANWGIIKPLDTPKKIKNKKLRKQMYAQRALDTIDKMVESLNAD
jgi:methylenetetrahydrofolate--tRNA-(uracil-5-)-methyltransferase